MGMRTHMILKSPIKAWVLRNLSKEPPAPQKQLQPTHSLSNVNKILQEDKEGLTSLPLKV